MTLIEVSIAAMVLVVAVFAILEAIIQSGRLSHSSQRKEQGIAYGQRQVEQIRSLGFSSVALSGTPAHESDAYDHPRTPNYYVSDGPPRCFTLKASYRSQTPAPGEACEPLITGGSVDPGPATFNANGTTGKVYRYVTAAPAGCLTAPVSACLDGSGAHLRRVVVAVVLDPTPNLKLPRPMYFSSLVADPGTAPLAIGP
jgi:hypothetical protein